MLDLFLNLAQTDLIRPPDNIPMVADEASLTALFNFAFGILGGISLIMITLQGMRYAFSDGDPGKTKQARMGIIYALIGIVIALAGASIVNFVLDAALPSATGRGAVIGSESLLVRIAGLMALITGVISVIVIVINGYKFALSNGDATKAASARNGIIYALVGVVIAAVAGPLIIYALGRAIG